MKIKTSLLHKKSMTSDARFRPLRSGVTIDHHNKLPITGNTIRLADLCFRWFNRHGFHVMAGRPGCLGEQYVRYRCDGVMVQ
jgi:hypothetical protein